MRKAATPEPVLSGEHCGPPGPGNALRCQTSGPWAPAPPFTTPNVSSVRKTCSPYGVVETCAFPELGGEEGGHSPFGMPTLNLNCPESGDTVLHSVAPAGPGASALRCDTVFPDSGTKLWRDSTAFVRRLSRGKSKLDDFLWRLFLVVPAPRLASGGTLRLRSQTRRPVCPVPRPTRSDRRLLDRARGLRPTVILRSCRLG